MEEYMTKEQVMELTGANARLVETWAKRLQNTSLVADKRGRTDRVRVTDDFVTFIRTRVDNPGAAYLPNPERIDLLFHLWHKNDVENDELTVVAIAGELGESPPDVLVDLRKIGLC